MSMEVFGDDRRFGKERDTKDRVLHPSGGDLVFTMGTNGFGFSLDPERVRTQLVSKTEMEGMQRV